MTRKTHGIVHGNTIEVLEDLGIPDGQRVALTVEQVQRPTPGSQRGDGARRCAVSLADIPGLTEDMAQILSEREAATFREVSP